ncbi:hydroxymethylglutaryl-CoA reductase, degradative [Sphingomonas abietis]|uniref:3-hydroxy-3-methylglutaryl coenzyme A reductase n=1 Tax=Sphingomonas abietis TaxID=3012344 RepID=A0ABY7NIJ5_9SPHN|nr:hydroxymethylglutaryl-CoA reductase, degradative [Sphingomonas abietis]WBO21339.1 hydroxymethylglutaryl-CoA reductase, degradative [Sphingomonas abietis]
MADPPRSHAQWVATEYSGNASDDDARRHRISPANRRVTDGLMCRVVRACHPIIDIGLFPRGWSFTLAWQVHATHSRSFVSCLGSRLNHHSGPYSTPSPRRRRYSSAQIAPIRTSQNPISRIIQDQRPKRGTGERPLILAFGPLAGSRISSRRVRVLQETSPKTSRISGFHKLEIAERLKKVSEFATLDQVHVDQLSASSNIDAHLADHMIENMISTIAIPVGVATNMKIDGRDLLVPMATEESSVIAAVGNSSRQCYENGGFTTSMSGTQMIAQIQLLDLTDPATARVAILERRSEIEVICNECDPLLVRFGGGFRDLEVRLIEAPSGTMVITHIVIDTKDAMGANAVNTMAERLAPQLAEWTGGRPLLRILSNLADRRVARARATWRCEDIGGEAVRDAMIAAYEFADTDPYRAATHNKGIMNGVSAVVLATGNDTRAVEAGAHAYAAKDGWYRSLSRWEVTKNGDLSGVLEMPMAVGLIGGATKIHPTARAALAILDVDSAEHLARIIAAVGLAQNFGAMKALATDGIQKGHMALHAQNVAITVGATGEEVAEVARRLIESKSINTDTADKLLAEIRGA